MRPHALFARFAAIAALLPSIAVAQKTIHVPADAPTIQSAIDSSSNGDTVLVDPGTYYENINFHGHNITVTSSGGAAATILDGSKLASTVTFASGETNSATISGFTIRNGSSPSSSAEGGGGIAVLYASPTIQNNILTDNYCAGINVQGSPVITGNTITRTHTYSPLIQCEYPGTALLLYGESRATVRGNTFIANTESTWGTVLIWASEDNLLENNVFRDNAMPGPGCVAAICMDNSFAVTIDGNEISANSNRDQGASAIELDLITLTFGAGSGQLPLGAPLVRILNNTIANNGGGQGTQVRLANSHSRTVIANNIITSNAQSAGVVCVANTSAPSEGSDPVVQSNDSFIPTAAFSGCGTVDSTNITTNPQLTTDANLHLVPTAAAIDTGNNSVLPQPAVDVAGDARVQSTAAPARVDMGAMEVAGSVKAPQSRLVIAPSRYEVGTGQTVDVTAALVTTGTADATPATVTLYLDGAAVQTASVTSALAATFSGVAIPSGTHELYASTPGTASIPAASSLSVRVDNNAAAPTYSGVQVQMEIDPIISIGSQLSGQVRCSLNTGGLSGRIRTFDNGYLLTDNAVSGTSIANATFFTTAGPHIYQCDYQGTIASSTVGTQIVAAPPPAIGPSTYELFSLPDPTEYGDPVTIGGTATPYDPTTNTTLSITEGANVILNKPLDSTGSATIVTTTLTPGVHTFQGVFTVNGVALGSSGGTFTQTVHFAPTRTSLAAAPTTGSTTTTAITLTIATASSYTGTPLTGTVTLFNGTTALPIAGVLNGTVTLPPGTLPAGTSVLTAVYNGTSIFAPSTSNAVTVTLTTPPPPPPPPPPDFSITPAAPSLTLQTEHHATVALTLTAINGFNGPVSLACSNLPPVATCTFSAAQYQLSSTTPVSFVLETDALAGYKSQVEGAPLRPAKLLRYALALPLLLLFARRRSSALRAVCLLVTGAALLTGLSACSGKYPAHTPPGSYTPTITATGTSGSTTVTHTVPFALTVTPD